MKIEQHNNTLITHLTGNGIIINEAEDALDIIGNSTYQGSRKIILHADNIAPAFFDLTSRLAGEVLQKFTNYECELAIIGDYTKYNSESLQAFIRESNRTGKIVFVKNLSEAVTRLSR